MFSARLKRRPFVAMLLAACVTTPAFAQSPKAPSGEAGLQKVASFQHQVTGVAVTETGRIFVNFPRWSEDAPVSLGELTPDGKLHPYPNDEWNRYRNAAPLSPADHFVCVQAETADGHGSLWVIDPAAPNTEFIVPGGPKLVKIDLAGNKVARTYAFAPDVAPQGSYLNDVRLSPDGKTAYITDSGASGALVVVDLDSGKGRRLLDGDVSTQPDKSVKVMSHGRELHQPDGRGVQFAADSIALDPKGEYLYWQPLTGKILYRIATATLRDASLSPDAVASKVEKVGQSAPNDGLWIDRAGTIYFTAIEDDAVETQASGGGPRRVLVKDPRLVWPDTFAEGPDKTLYVTNSAIQNSPRFNAHGWTVRTFNLWKIVPKAAGTIDGNPAFGSN